MLWEQNAFRAVLVDVPEKVDQIVRKVESDVVLHGAILEGTLQSKPA